MPLRRDLLGGAGALLASTALAGPVLVGPAMARSRAPARAAEPVPDSPASSPVGPLHTPAKQVLLLDATTGAVLLNKGADERMRPSSMSKLMTVYLSGCETSLAASAMRRARATSSGPARPSGWSDLARASFRRALRRSLTT
ncbi:hypothetical protein [Teichococcus vastitatis]|uniref:Peptidase S11 D-alanyl-D-alanine carboxypeptidase A N-terminal domain-containing protein n=1 Tax=Teichococcus vastitatis TaxID=2307076 RepID=A0ABS9W7I9_9PROT|nr:hypothetical protein [Pseudoroseomonas vastitatis]MCI0755262.1 hypothetical protein [Pseudoroseomonas vastitatis]